ncbi:unnamed protein product [Allacma fusca]|uniref:Uncharacterized protein n=1 Tax=Allacma fusca TaxID=39272 RepID=A0A8J2NXV4_9HEXA|nr:unnamed protein product [Allacma fusca]
MLSEKNSLGFKLRGKKPTRIELVLPQNVQLDMEQAQFLELSLVLENDYVGSDNRPAPKQRDFKIVGFTELFQLEELNRYLKCSGANCKIRPSPTSYAFCENFHLFCGGCIQNLPFCWMRDSDEHLCQKKFCTAEIPLYTDCLTRYSFPCQFTGCKTGSKSFEEMIVHLRHRHRSIFVERPVTAVSLRIPWVSAVVDDYTWIPLIFKTNDVYVLLTLKFKYGTLYQWVYVEDERPREDRDEIYILSGFEIAEREITMLKEDPPQFLSTPISKITDDPNCFAVDFDDFYEAHLMLDGQKQIPYFIFDLDIALL